MISDTDNIRKICLSRVLLYQKMLKHLKMRLRRTWQIKVPHQKQIIKNHVELACWTETGPVSKAGLKMFSKAVSESKDQVYGAWLSKTETGPVLKTVFRNSCQEQKQRIKIKYMELGCGRPNSNTNVVCTRMDTLDTQKGGKMRYLKKASMMRNTNY